MRRMIKILTVLVLAITCVLLQLLYPGWRSEARAQGYGPNGGLGCESATALRCHDSAVEAMNNAIADVRQCTSADNQTREYGTVVFERDDRKEGEQDCFMYQPPLPGEDGEFPLAGEVLERADFDGTPTVAVHSHNNPEENGYITSPGDFEFSEDNSIPIYTTADGPRGSCLNYWDPQDTYGQGRCRTEDDESMLSTTCDIYCLETGR